jgi:hypothetical protein
LQSSLVLHFAVVGESVGAIVGATVGGAVGASVAAVGVAVGDAVGDSVGLAVGEAVFFVDVDAVVVVVMAFVVESDIGAAVVCAAPLLA